MVYYVLNCIKLGINHFCFVYKYVPVIKWWIPESKNEDRFPMRCRRSFSFKVGPFVRQSLITNKSLLWSLNNFLDTKTESYHLLLHPVHLVLYYCTSFLIEVLTTTSTSSLSFHRSTLVMSKIWITTLRSINGLTGISCPEVQSTFPVLEERKKWNIICIYLNKTNMNLYVLIK